jgi:hypothetical protein
MTLKALPIAILLTLAAMPAMVTCVWATHAQAADPSVWTLPSRTPAKAPALKDTALPAMRASKLTLKDVIVARYAEEPTEAGMFHIFRKMTVLDRQLADRDIYIPWLSRDEALPRVGAHCDIRYHMGAVGGGGSLLKADTSEAPGDSRIMDDFVCKPVGKT